MRPKLCVIAPTKFNTLPMLRDRPYQLVLAPQVLRCPEDHLFPLSYVILDNGLWELGESVRWANVMEAANICCPDEIVLPDKFKNAIATINAAEQLGNVKKPRFNDAPVNFAVVIQGSTPEEVLDCYNVLANMPYVDVIHIPKVVESIWPYGGRAGFLAYLDDEKLLADKPHHLLGVWSTVEEIRLARPWIRSVDTALPIHSALQGKPISTGQHIEKTKRPKDYFEWKPWEVQPGNLKLIKANIGAIDEICSSA